MRSLQKSSWSAHAQIVAGWIVAACFAGCAANDDTGSQTAPTANTGGQAGSSSDRGGGGSGGVPPVGSGGSGESGTAGPTGGGGASSDPGQGGDGGSQAGSGGGADAGVVEAGAPGTDGGGADGGVATVGPKTSLIWVWLAYKTSFASIAANAKSFTHVSPALYQINYAYTSGVTKLVNANDSYDGLTSSQMVDQVHAAGLKIVPLMYGGAGNFGTDQGIQNILSDAPAGTQNNFITSMVGEAMTKKYDGYNLDWEVQGTTYSKFGTKLITFLAAFKSALNQHGMILTIDLAGWYIRQCSGSGDDGLIDLAAVGHSVDLAIIENYAGSLGNPATTCPAMPAKSTNCDSDFVTQTSVMCSLPKDVASIGLISTGSNSFAPGALDAIAHFGYTNVAVWPDDAMFLNPKGMPQGDTWYTVLADFMSK